MIIIPLSKSICFSHYQKQTPANMSNKKSQSGMQIALDKNQELKMLVLMQEEKTC